MRLLPIAICLSLASKLSASPVPAVKWVTEYQYKTVTVGYDEYTAYLASAAKNKGELSKQPSTPTAEEQTTETTPVTQAAAETQQFQAQSQVTEAPSVLSISSPVETQSPTSTQPASTTSDGSLPTGATFSGEGTYYDPDMGACGKVNSADEMIVAISHELYDKYTPNGNPNKNSLCGKKIEASYEGKSVTVTIVDRCVGCAHDDLDLSPAAFEKIADKDLGRINLTWQWAN